MMDFKAGATLDAAAKAVADTFEGIAFSQILDQEQLVAPPRLKNRHFAALIHLPQPIRLTFLMAVSMEHATECFESVAPGIELCPRIDQYCSRTFSHHSGTPQRRHDHWPTRAGCRR